MSEMLRENPQKLAKRASLYLILIIAMLAPYQAAQAWIISFGPGGTIYIHLQISGGSYDPVTDVYVYSKSTAIDTKSTPRFESRNDDVGTWHNGFVQYGPGSKSGSDCRTLPKGGVRFFTEGKGIGKGQSATFSFTAEAEEKEWFIDYFDTDKGAWTLGVKPTPGEPPVAKRDAEPPFAKRDAEPEPPKFGRRLLLILLVLGAAYWYYTEGRKKRGPSGNGPDAKTKDRID